MNNIKLAHVEDGYCLYLQGEGNVYEIHSFIPRNDISKVLTKLYDKYGECSIDVL